MTINEVEIRQADNNEVTVGTVSEYEIKITECVRECDIDGETRKVNSAWIGGTLVVDVNGTSIKHTFRYLDTIRHKKNGDENKVFKGLITALGYDVEFDAETKKLTYTQNGSGLIPKMEGKITWVNANKDVTDSVTIKRSGDPTRVKITSRLSLAEGLNKDQSDLAFYNELPISYISTTNVADTDSAMFTIEGVIKEIADEYSANGSTTGRYLVDLVVPNFFGVDVMPFVMLDKWTNTNEDGESFEVTKDMFYVPNSQDSFCQLGDTVKLSGDIESHSFGNVATETTSKKTFGGGAKNVRNGFSRTEWTIKAGDIVEGNDVYDTELIAKALEERDVILDNNYKKRLEDYNNAKSNQNTTKTASPKGASASAKANNPFGASTKKNPFAK